MKKAFKYLGFLILGLVILFFFVARFSAVESSFRCSGEISNSGTVQPATVYMKLTEYRWWVNLWGDSAGSLHLEIPKTSVESFGHIEEIGDLLTIYETYPQKTLKGNFSKLSKTLSIQTSRGFFDGACTAN